MTKPGSGMLFTQLHTFRHLQPINLFWKNILQYVSRVQGSLGKKINLSSSEGSRDNGRGPKSNGTRSKNLLLEKKYQRNKISRFQFSKKNEISENFDI